MNLGAVARQYDRLVREEWLYRWDDSADPWSIDSQGPHVICGALFWDALGRVPLGWRVAVFLIGAIGWEIIVEAVRFRRWRARGSPPPWPFATDRCSLKDVLGDLAGIPVILLVHAVRGV